MYFVIDGSIWDPDLDLLSDLVAVLDGHLEAVSAKCQGSFADELGCFDRMEHVVGLGFTACQTYLTATYGFIEVPKSTALLVGPRHRSGRSVAEVVNHAANYWKHNEEWTLDKSPVHRQRIE